MPNAQQAVWRNGGCNSAESVVGNWTLVPRMTDSEPRHFAKSPPRCMQPERERGDKEMREWETEFFKQKKWFGKTKTVYGAMGVTFN